MSKERTHRHHTPKFELDEIVWHETKGRPWRVEYIWPWSDCAGQGEWRYTLERPQDFIERLKRKMRATGCPPIRILKKCIAWEGELQKSAKTTRVFFGSGLGGGGSSMKKTKGGIIVPGHVGDS